MSKKILAVAVRSRHQSAVGLAVYFGLLVALVAAFCLSDSVKSSAQHSSATATTNTALVATTEEVLKETSEIRRLAILRPVQCSAQSRVEIERMIRKNLDEETTPAQMHATEVTLKTLGLVPADFDFRSLMIRLLTEQVAGYYDPKIQQFHLADWIDIDAQKPVMAHELTHALQDQHFNLRRFERWPKGDSDAELAVHALIEGDATQVMMQYVVRDPMRMVSLMKSVAASVTATDEINKAPRVVRETLLFPYQEGLSWTQALYRHAGDKQGRSEREDGWNEVSRAFTILPQSTEQILHPEKYFAHEPPVKVLLPDLTEVLNGAGSRSNIGGQKSDTTPLKTASSLHTPAAWNKIDFDVEGEWGFYLILDEFLNSGVDSRRAAAGWGGDRYAVYEDRNGHAMYVSLSSWDTEADAREFFEAYLKRTQLRYPNARAEVDSPTGSKLFQTPAGETAIRIQGTRVLVAEGLPDATVRAAVIKTLQIKN